MIETKTITVTATGQQVRIPLDPAKNNMIMCDAGDSDVFSVQGASEIDGTLVELDELSDWSGVMQEAFWGVFAELSITVDTLVSSGFTFKIHSSPRH